MNAVLKELVLPKGKTLQIVQGDITTEKVDAIVNAANENLAHGGGVAWAISKNGGPLVQQESDEWIRKHGPVSHTHPAWTSGGLLPAKYIIHAVGPVWGSGGEDQKLSDAVMGSFHVADELKCKSVSLPAISTGIFGFPKDQAARIIFSSINEYFARNQDSGIQQIRIILFDVATLQVFMKLCQAYLSSKKKKPTLSDWIEGITELFS
jgi:O-acetyl-ADP-ribose deacetylase (regulator of RNase III)